LMIFDQLDPSAQAPWTTTMLTSFEDIVRSPSQWIVHNRLDAIRTVT
jgi:hypothetical protein